MHRTSNLVLVSLLILVGCTSGGEPTESPEQVAVSGDYFPKGDPGRGYDVFERRRCAACHVVRGYDFPASRRALPVRRPLGTVVDRMPSDLSLFTAIVDPAHELAPDHLEALDRETPGIMRSFRGIMTVQEVLDVVAFVRTAYDVRPDGR